jgi:hypothetical protein
MAKGRRVTFNSSDQDKPVILDPRFEETMDKMDMCARIYDSMTFKEFANPKKYFGDSLEESESRIKRMARGSGFSKQTVKRALRVLGATSPKGIVKINTFILNNLALNPSSEYYKDVVKPEIDNPSQIEPLFHNYLDNVGKGTNIHMWARAELMTSLSKHDLQTEDAFNRGQFNPSGPRMKMKVETPYESIERIVGRSTYVLSYHGLPMKTEYE